uniref:Uncharacterized protein n=1 Tax=Amazona collaria TaxID=241587 RepID=A0A8B9F505_9PSIT
MAEEKEDSSSTELDVPAADLHSSTEDLLSDSALHGTEYYRDLGLLSLPIARAAPETAAQPQQAAQAVSALRLLEERPGALSEMSVDVAFSNPVSCSVRYGEADCRFLNKGHVCSCAAVPEDGTSASEGPAEPDKELELQEAEEFFPTLVRSMSTSRRHSWESPLSPTDCKRRFSLDATEMGSDPEQEDMEKGTQSCPEPCVSLQLPKGELEAWSSSRGSTVIKVEIEPLHLSPTVSPALEEVVSVRGLCALKSAFPALHLLCPSGGSHGAQSTKGIPDFFLLQECGSSRKRLRSKSVPSGCEAVVSLQTPCGLNPSLPAVKAVEPPALEMLEKDHVSPDHVAKQRAHVREGSDCSQQNLTWFEFLSNENEDSGKSDKAEKGTKVMRRLSSLRSRVTGSWQKEKVRERC